MDEQNLGCISVGVILSVIGVAMVANGTDTGTLAGGISRTPVFYIGFLVAGLGALVALVGVIAIGVSMGMRSAAKTEPKRVSTPSV